MKRSKDHKPGDRVIYQSWIVDGVEFGNPIHNGECGTIIRRNARGADPTYDVAWDNRGHMPDPVSFGWRVLVLDATRHYIELPEGYYEAITTVL